MCEVTPEGYKMDDGKLIRFTDKLESIPPKYSTELSNNVINAWDGFLIHRSILDLEEKIIPVLAKISNHTEDCPINKNAIKSLALDEIKKFGKTKWAGFFGKTRDLSVIIFMILGIIALVKNFL